MLKTVFIPLYHLTHQHTQLYYASHSASSFIQVMITLYGPHLERQILLGVNEAPKSGQMI